LEICGNGKLKRNVTVLDWNQAEQGELVVPVHDSEQGLVTTHNYLVSSPQLLGSGPQDWFLVIGSSYFTTTRSEPMDGS
jgi:hypothetical protein